MRINFTLFIVLVFITFSVILKAQDSPKANDLDQKYTPAKNSIFNSDGKTASGDKKFSVIKQDISFYPFLLIRNVLAVFYERSLNDQITMQGGIGTCIGKDKVQSTVATSDFGFSSSNQSLGVGNLMQKCNFVTGGNIFVAASIKVYLYGEPFDENYFECGIRYNVNNLQVDPTLNAITSSTPIYGNPSVSVHNLDFTLIWGHKITTRGSLKTTHNFYAGFGLRKANYDTFTLEQMQNNSTGSPQTTEYYVSTNSRENSLWPMFIAGYALGFGF